MKRSLLFVVLALAAAPASADILYQQPPNPAGGSFMSAWWDPDGSNYDRYLWDAFTLVDSASIRSIEWRGTFGASGPATDFTVAIYASIPAGTQPDVAHPPLVEYQAGGNAGQTYAGTFGGVMMYDHHFTLPAAFHAEAGVKYWVQIEGWQQGFPDWSIAASLVGDGSYFLCEHNNIANLAGVPTGCWFTSRTGNAAFALLSSGNTGVDDAPGRAEFAIRGVSPNPSRGERLDVTFSLPDAGAARLALYDVSGRTIASEEVGALGPGRHVVDLARRGPIRPGIYFLRLARDGHEVATRVAIVR